ncbi:hypothetical protein PoB_003683100 [Plakobranchus ocellatus]|uniref:Uncharacterized protein n=1 Tax=Plakobranchus ocellatus TaxID=259542 RepID=A0AAV4AQ88_9GAST|nr:hypothetical protein PoB_003683100 [Plakobranchus ocellatus]
MPGGDKAERREGEGRCEMMGGGGEAQKREGEDRWEMPGGEDKAERREGEGRCEMPGVGEMLFVKNQDQAVVTNNTAMLAVQTWIFHMVSAMASR